MRIGFVAVVLSSAALASEPGSEQRLVEDARAALNVSFPRPSPCEKTLEGTFASRAEPHLARLNALKRELNPESMVLPEEIRNLSLGAPDMGALSPEGQRFLERATPHAEGVLEATCASNGALPEAFSIFNAMRVDEPISWIDVQDAIRISALGAGRPSPDRAQRQWRICIQGLSIARDLSRGIMISRMVANAAARIAAVGCESAINQASEEQLATSVHELRAVSDWAPYAKVLEHERLFGQLLFEASLSDETKEALPPEAKVFFADVAKSEFTVIPTGGVRMFLFGSWARRKHYAQMTEAIRLSELPPVEAGEQLRTLFEDRPLAYALLGTLGESDFRSFLLRDAETRTLLVLLQAAARARHFRLWSKYDAWPPTPMDDFDLGGLLEVEAVPGEDDLTFRITTPPRPDNPPPEIVVTAP